MIRRLLHWQRFIVPRYGPGFNYLRVGIFVTFLLRFGLPFQLLEKKKWVTLRENIVHFSPQVMFKMDEGRLRDT